MGLFSGGFAPRVPIWSSFGIHMHTKWAFMDPNTCWGPHGPICQLEILGPDMGSTWNPACGTPGTLEHLGPYMGSTWDPTIPYMGSTWDPTMPYIESTRDSTWDPPWSTRDPAWGPPRTLHGVHLRSHIGSTWDPTILLPWTPTWGPPGTLQN